MTAPATYTVPKVNGDADAARQIAAAYRDLADAVDESRRRVTAVVAGLTGNWQGVGHRATRHPLEVTARQALALARVLRAAAGQFDDYARQLERAHHRHWYSIGNLLKIGAVVAVSATTIVVTVGAASVVEAAAASAAVAGAADAAGAAAAASATTAGEVVASLASLGSMQPLLSFLLPRLLQAEWTAAATATYDEITEGRLDWRAIADNLGFVAVGSTAAEAAVRMTGVGGWTAAAVRGGSWTGLEAGDRAGHGDAVDPIDLAETFVLVGGGGPARDALRARGWWPSEPDYRRAALVGLLRRPGPVRNPAIAAELSMLRQPLPELARGDVDLRISEGPGHTLDRHIGRGGEWLLGRVRRERIRNASSFFDEATARDAVARTLRQHAATLRAWAADGGSPQLRLHAEADQPIGYTVDRRGVVRLARRVCVVITRDPHGLIVRTSYPEVVSRCR